MFDIGTLVTVHTVLSLIAIVAGFPAIADLFAGRVSTLWSSLFLVTAILTSATGFLFPFNVLLPSHIVGALALVVLAVMLVGRYAFGLAGAWRGIYAAGIVVSQYFLVFVGIAQAFQKIGFLNAIAPTQSSPGFAVAQVIALVAFLWVGFKAVRGFHPPAMRLV